MSKLDISLSHLLFACCPTWGNGGFRFGAILDYTFSSVRASGTGWA